MKLGISMAESKRTEVRTASMCATKYPPFRQIGQCQTASLCLQRFLYEEMDITVYLVGGILASGDMTPRVAFEKSLEYTKNTGNPPHWWLGWRDVTKHMNRTERDIIDITCDKQQHYADGGIATVGSFVAPRIVLGEKLDEAKGSFIRVISMVVPFTQNPLSKKSAEAFEPVYQSFKAFMDKGLMTVTTEVKHKSGDKRLMSTLHERVNDG